MGVRCYLEDARLVCMHSRPFLRLLGKDPSPVELGRCPLMIEDPRGLALPKRCPVPFSGPFRGDVGRDRGPWRPPTLEQLSGAGRPREAGLRLPSGAGGGSCRFPRDRKALGSSSDTARTSPEARATLCTVEYAMAVRPIPSTEAGPNRNRNHRACGPSSQPRAARTAPREGQVRQAPAPAADLRGHASLRRVPAPSHLYNFGTPASASLPASTCASYRLNK